jgi:hypothetical protein
MSIALPVRRRRPAAKSGWVCRPKERPLSVLPAIVEFVIAPVTILLGASFLKREMQIFGGVLLGYGHGFTYFRADDRGHDRPEHHQHTHDARGESGLEHRPMKEAEARQR